MGYFKYSIMINLVVMTMIYGMGSSWASDVSTFDFNKPVYNQPKKVTTQTLALYHFDKGMGDVASDDGPYSFDGKLMPGVRWSSEGKFSSSLEFNGVDSAMIVSHAFTEPNIRISFYFCPLTEPSETVSETFSKVFTGQEHNFFFWGDYFARGGKAPEWGVRIAEGMGKREEVRGSEGANQYLMCTDDRESGFVQQMYLDRKDGRLRWHHFNIGEYTYLASKEPVWKKGMWTHAAIDLNVRNQKAVLWINGEQNTEGPLTWTGADWRYFVLGGSLRDGVPFAGKIDELDVTFFAPHEQRFIATGDMEGPFYQKNEDTGKMQGPFYQKDAVKDRTLPFEFQPYGFVKGKDITFQSNDSPAGGKFCLQLDLKSAETTSLIPRGIVASPRVIDDIGYEVRVAVRGRHGKAKLTIAESEGSLASSEHTKSIELNGTWQVLSLNYTQWLPVPYTSPLKIFLTFDSNGTYFVDNFFLVEKE